MLEIELCVVVSRGLVHRVVLIDSERLLAESQAS